MFLLSKKAHNKDHAAKMCSYGAELLESVERCQGQVKRAMKSERFALDFVCHHTKAMSQALLEFEETFAVAGVGADRARKWVTDAVT
jgi:hypothetical protein